MKKLNLLHILPKDWMRTRRPDELRAMRNKLGRELDNVVGDIQPLADRLALDPKRSRRLEDLRSLRTQLDQVIEDLDAVIAEKEACREAA